eukprot:scaffold1007_cov176-Amphora_coffeaeformis.AAC.33
MIRQHVHVGGQDIVAPNGGSGKGHGGVPQGGVDILSGLYESSLLFLFVVLVVVVSGRFRRGQERFSEIIILITLSRIDKTKILLRRHGVYNIMDVPINEQWE